jgi:DNA-binding MarR family transcriptional regulator
VVSKGSDDADWLDGLIESLEAFRTFNKDVTVNQALTFLYVARKPGITQTETLKKLGLATGGSSRIVSSLSQYGGRNSKTPGWRLLQLEENPNDRRFKNMMLTDEGIKFMERIRASMKKVACKMREEPDEK